MLANFTFLYAFGKLKVCVENERFVDASEK
jgi:hypothetical protein